MVDMRTALKRPMNAVQYHFITTFLWADSMQLSKHAFEIPIYVSHLPNAEQLNEKLKEVVDKLDAPEVKTPGSPITKSSWGRPQLNKQWHPIFFGEAMPHLTELYNQLKTPHWQIMHAWFQTYRCGDTHRAHNHGGCTWANVYYVELSDPKYGTVFYHPARHWVELRQHLQSDSPPVLRPEVKPGDIVSFPGYLEHEAPLIQSDATKTIISFNIVATPGPGK